MNRYETSSLVRIRQSSRRSAKRPKRQAPHAAYSHSTTPARLGRAVQKRRPQGRERENRERYEQDSATPGREQEEASAAGEIVSLRLLWSRKLIGLHRE